MATNNVFKDKVVVITGSTGGVGRATAWEFAKQGAKRNLMPALVHISLLALRTITLLGEIIGNSFTDQLFLDAC